MEHVNFDSENILNIKIESSIHILSLLIWNNRSFFTTTKNTSGFQDEYLFYVCNLTFEVNFLSCFHLTLKIQNNMCVYEGARM